jgi:hypothetical protein
VIIRLVRRPWVRVSAALLAIVAGVGLYWFQPWKLVTDTRVEEALAAVPSAPSAVQPSGSPSPAPSGPTVLRQGDFISHEHDTAGQARLIRNADGSHALELVGLDTSNGPDLRVRLSDRPVLAGVRGWRVFGDGVWVELGRLKGNKGDQVYRIPADTDLGRLTSVTIWCERFSVSFGAAALEVGS